MVWTSLSCVWRRVLWHGGKQQLLQLHQLVHAFLGDAMAMLPSRSQGWCAHGGVIVCLHQTLKAAAPVAGSVDEACFSDGKKSEWSSCSYTESPTWGLSSSSGLYLPLAYDVGWAAFNEIDSFSTAFKSVSWAHVSFTSLVLHGWWSKGSANSSCKYDSGGKGQERVWHVEH